MKKKEQLPRIYKKTLKTQWSENKQPNFKNSVPKTLIGHLTKEDLQVMIILKDALNCMSSGKCKLRQWNNTTHLLEWPKVGTLTTPNAGKDVE